MKNSKILIISSLLILLFATIAFLLFTEVFTKNEVLEHPIRYKTTVCDFSKIKSSQDVMDKMMKIQSFMDDSLTDKEEVFIEKIFIESMVDSTINPLILDMNSVGLLQSLLARYDEELHYIRKDHPSNNSFIGMIKLGLFDYPEPTFNSSSHLLFEKVMSCKNLTYEAAKSFFNSYVFNDTVDLVQNRSILYNLLVYDSNFNDYSIGVLELTLEEVNMMGNYQSRDSISHNDRLSAFKERLSGFLQTKKE